MNFLKRAWWRLTGYLGKTAMLVGVFFVICTLVLSGFLIQSAAARAAEDAKQRVGAVATMRLDPEALSRSGKMGSGPDGNQAGVIGPAGDLPRAVADKICESSVVVRCNYKTEAAAFPSESTTKNYRQPGAGPIDENSDYFTVEGIRDQEGVSAFRNGDAKVTAGSGIRPNSKGNAVVIEQRLAKLNGVKVGDTLRLRASPPPLPGEEPKYTVHNFKIIGIFKSDEPAPGPNMPSGLHAANRVYVTADGATKLRVSGERANKGIVSEATFTLSNPADLAPLKKDAKAAGADLEIFPLIVNDKQYRTLVGPITKTADFATVTVWLVAVAGTVILALIVASALRERRTELGILLALGERKPRLLGQHLTEVVACAVLAVGLASACSGFLSQAIGDQLLASEVSSAKDEAKNQPSGDNGTLPMGGMAPEPESEVEPIDSMSVRLGPSDIAKVGATGLGIAALATLVPGSRVLRLHPREILTKGE
ncbi:ABC transporter permease [Streptomyces sp. NPDC004726]